MSESREDDAGGGRFLVEVSDVLGLKEPLTELVRAVCRGIGNVFEPWRRKRAAKADIAIFEAWKRAVSDVDQLPSAFEFSLEERTAVRMLTEQRRQQANRERVAIAAIEEARREPATGAPDRPLADEWIDRFWRLAQDISHEDLQRLWGRILSREAKRPGTVSRLALETISLLTQEDAKDVEALAKLTCRIDPPFVESACAVWCLRPCVYNSTFSGFSDRALEHRLEEALSRLRKSCRHHHFRALGLLRDSGWAYSVRVSCPDRVVILRIASKSFVLRGFSNDESRTARDGGRPPAIGDGEDWTSVGREILDLIETQPDPHYLSILEEGWRHFGLELAAFEKVSSGP